MMTKASLSSDGFVVTALLSPLKLPLIACALAFTAPAAEVPAAATPARMLPLNSVRLLAGPFADAVKANRTYLLALDPDRLLAPYFREAGLQPKAKVYGNWESSGLDGHTAGHYLSALATMIASGADTPEGELKRRLNYMVSELDRCQKASSDGYLGGVPGSRELWQNIAAGRVEAINRKWVPWYNLHKTYAGLRDAYWLTGNQQAREILVRCGDWCEKITSGLSDEQMQRMLGQEHGGINEVLADIYVITGDEKYLRLARRFHHKAVLDPLERHQDQLTGKHANTQIPKVIGLERIATLTGDQEADSGARFFWENVTGKRTVAFGGNSDSEHFNDPKNFRGMLESREGPETCNTYNMLQLTKQLFASQPSAAYADYYERALYNHILASINPDHPGYVYFTPIRPDHYRVYSQPDKCFWCCVGTGIENPGRYGEFIYAQATNGLYVNLFIASEITVTNLGLTLRQETAFPDEARIKLTLKLKKRSEFTLHIRHPGWVAAGEFAVKVNGKPFAVASTPSSYAAIHRKWRNGDRVEVELPMRTTVERLPDGSDWVAILRGPIVLASPAGTNNLRGLYANDSRMGQVASGPLVPMDQVPVLLASASELPQHVKSDPAAGPMRFRLVDVVEPSAPNGLPLIPFFRLHDARYQMYWQLTTKAELAAKRERLAAEERAKALRETSTLDRVAPGEQQPEVEHDFQGEGSNTGLAEGRRYRDGQSFQYTLNPRGEKAVDLVVTYWGGDSGRTFDILANGTLLATQELKAEKPGEFIEKRYSIQPDVLAAAADGRVTIKFIAKIFVAGGIFDLRLMKAESPSSAALPTPAPGSNPIFRNTFTADPAALVVGDTLYCYTGHDKAVGGQFFTMPDWLCYSTKDMKNWTPHGTVLKAHDFKYGSRNSAWAAQVIEKSGKYYFYVTLTLTNSGEHCIAVAVGDSPLGPFQDARGTPLITDDMTTDSRRPNADIDPTIFIDDDGTPWLAWGNGDCYLVKLKPNMIELDGPIKKLDITPQFSEGPWLYKRGKLYYNVFAADVPGVQPEQIGYATAPAVEGPWTYHGLVTGKAKVGFTIHPAVVEFKGQWYFFYHDGSTALNGQTGGACRRSVCVEYLDYNPDGTIKPITQTAEGVSVPPKK